MTAAYDAALYATDRRTLVFVDAGFLLTVMQAHHQVTERSMLVIDHPGLIELLRKTAEGLLGCPVLRIYWYDAAHPSRRIPNLVAAEMARVDGVRVRLGTLNIRPDGRFEQKAVDTLLVRDMIAHAYKKTAQEMVLVSGDNDLVPGVEEAQEQGVRVHLWSIKGDDLPPSVGRHLADLADTRYELDAGELADTLGKVTKPSVEVSQVTAAVPAEAAATEQAPTADSQVAAPLDGAPVGWDEPVQATPAAVASLDPGQQSEAVSFDYPVSASSAGDVPPPMTPLIVSPRDQAASIGAQSPAVLARSDEDAFPRLYDLDRDAYNAPFSGADAAAVGAEYARRWAAVVGRAVVASVLERHEPGFDGNIPRKVDSDLLYFGSDHGLDTYAQPKKFALRRGFWAGIQQAASAG